MRKGTGVCNRIQRRRCRSYHGRSLLAEFRYPVELREGTFAKVLVR